MLLPVALNAKGRRVLVVGGGAVAARKVGALLECGALVTVIAPELGANFPGGVEHRARVFEAGDCAGFFLVFAATNRREVNAMIAREARESGVWCNSADDPQGSDFHTSSVVRRGAIAVGISTQGVSPVLARHVREEIELALGEEYGALLELAGELDIATRQRGEFWRRVVASETLVLLRAGRRAEARQVLADLWQGLNGREAEPAGDAGGLSDAG